MAAVKVVERGLKSWVVVMQPKKVVGEQKKTMCSLTMMMFFYVCLCSMVMTVNLEEKSLVYGRERKSIAEKRKRRKRDVGMLTRALVFIVLSSSNGTKEQQIVENGRIQKFTRSDCQWYG
jgi:hypothetical protein